MDRRLPDCPDRPDRPDCPDRQRPMQRQWQDPQDKLRKVLEELEKLPTSYSQSNPGIYMAHRDLNKKRAALEAEIAQQAKLKK